MPVAIHIGDPKAFWKPATARQRALGRAAGPPGVVVLRPRRPVLAAALRRLRAAVARHPKTTFIAVHFGNDPEDPGQRRAHARQVSQLLHRHGGARARDRPPPAGEDAALLREVPGPHPVRHRHRHRRRRRRHDVRLERRRRRPPAPTRSASSRRPGATSRRSTASSRARPPSRAAGRSTASACPSRCCARSTSTTRPACCAGGRPDLSAGEPARGGFD